MNPAMRRYYDVRAEEYDDWWRDEGRFRARERPGWDEDVEALCSALASLAPARTLEEVPLDEIAELMRRLRDGHGVSGDADLKRAVLQAYGLVRLTTRADEYLQLALGLL